MYTLDPVSGINLVDVSGALSDLVTQFTGEITSAAPIITGAIVLVAGVQIGFRWVKRLAGSIG